MQLVLVCRHLLQDAVSLRGVGTPDSHQETVFIGVKSLDFFVRQVGQVFRVDKRVTSAVQSHLAVNLDQTTQHDVIFVHRRDIFHQTLVVHHSPMCPL